MSGSPFRIKVLVPGATEIGGVAVSGYDTVAYRDEMHEWFDPLGLVWDWCPVTLATVDRVISGIAAAREAAEQPLIVFNLCDGDEWDGFPGLSVVAALERHGLPFTGADTAFYRISSSKRAMKAHFDAAGVAAPPLLPIDDPDADASRVGEQVGFPCILKLDLGADGLGLDTGSVVSNQAEYLARARTLLAHEEFRRRGILAQRFLAGREFSVLVVATPQSGGVMIYPPLEKLYDAGLPLHHRIMFHNCRYGAAFHAAYQLAPDDVAVRLAAIAERAFLALGGTGYGRVDLRLDAASGEPGILEVNANCGLSCDEPTISLTVAAAGQPYHALVAAILRDAAGRAGLAWPKPA